MAKTDDLTEDEQTPTDEPIVAPEPSEALPETTATTTDIAAGLAAFTSDAVPGEFIPDPFAGWLQDNATVRVGTWAGYPNYECSACQYASLDEAKTQAHISIHGQTFTQGSKP